MDRIKQTLFKVPNICLLNICQLVGPDRDGQTDSQHTIILQNVASDQSLHCLPYIQQYFRHINSLFFIVLGFNDNQPLWVILCHPPEKGRKKTEEIVEKMKEIDREERGTERKGKGRNRRNKNIPLYPYLLQG